MNFEVVPIVHDEYLSVTTNAEYSLENMYLFVERIKAEADRSKRNRILIDYRNFRGYISEAERFLGGKHLAAIFGPHLRSALVLPAEHITKLGEMTAVNRGAKFLVTADVDEALNFILG